jgi:hypothetical protein
MQPCPVCGSPGVDAAGYCVQCRTYRGLPDTAPASRRTRNIMLIPLIALSVTLAILVVAIVVVYAARADRGTNDPTASSSSSGKPNPAIDNCVVGTWKMNAYSEDVPVDGVGTVKFTGQGAQVRLRADGTGVTDYGSGTTFTGTISGVTYKLVVSGTVKFDYKAKDGTVSFSNLSASGKETVTRSGTDQQFTQDLTGSSDPANYTCAGDTMVEYTDQYRAEMGRLSRTG